MSLRHSVHLMLSLSQWSINLLTRENILSGKYVSTHQRLFPAGMLWNMDQIYLSMQSVLMNRVAEKPVWVFAYGSLMWNPLIAIEEMQRAQLKGWQRRFCIRLTSGRATPEHPGRMLSLDVGGCTDGIAFRLADTDLERELSIIWIREMITGLYRPVWSEVILADGTQVDALAFVSEINHPFYEPESSPYTVAELASSATGYIGTNAEYITQLATTLGAWGIEDEYIDELIVELEERAILRGKA